MMIERVKALMIGVTALFVAMPAVAQVGHEPAKSPYVDLEYKQELSVLFGYLSAEKDPAGIAPLSRPMLGLRYEITLAGPLALSSDLYGGSGHRNVIDPLNPPATRNQGTQSNPVLGADLALAMNLTGRKSWHSLVPQVRGGIGFETSRAKDDSTGYSFGTPFAFSLGGGVKYVPGGRFQLRADVTRRFFKMNYPETYYRIIGVNPPVLDAQTGRSFYTRHTMLTVGLSYLFGR